MKFKPLFDRVLVKPLEGPDTKGGLFIPDTAKEKPQKGEVIAVGPGKKDDDGNLVKPEVKAGDKVLFEKYSGTEIKLDDQEYVVVRADDVVAKLD